MMYAASLGLILLVMIFSHAGQINIKGKLFRVTKGKMLPDSQVTKLSSTGKIRCIGVCFSRLDCKSVNYKAKSNECHLNNRTVGSCSPELNEDPDYVFFDIAESEAGTCVRHTSPLGVHCESVDKNHQKCCLKNLVVDNCHFDDVPEESPTGATHSLACDPGYMAKDELHIVCQDNGTWSSPVCASVSSCGMVRQYQPTSGDGEYWLRLTNFDNYITRIYCHNMLASSPGAFLTLPNTNYGIFPKISSLSCQGDSAQSGNCIGGGEVWFNKIKVNIKNMKVSRSDRTFANGTDLYYGNAHDCYTPHDNNALRCGTRGRFTIDLRGTGWKVSKDQKWKVYGWQAMIEKIDRQVNGALIELWCGGYGGGCKPDGGLYLTPNP